LYFYGYWRPITDEVVEKYLRCGDPHYGFARIRCKECGAEYLRAFSCRCRGFCPSCSKRKSLDLAIFLEEELFRPVPHRHWVWSVPKMLRLLTDAAYGGLKPPPEKRLRGAFPHLLCSIVMPMLLH
jgi:hypothetical protein